MELFPPIHRRDLGRSPCLGPGPRLPGREGGMQERRRGTRPPPGSAAAGSALFLGFRASGALGFSSWLAADRKPSGPLGPSCARGPGRSLPRCVARFWAPSPTLGRWGEAGEQVGGSGPEAVPAPLPRSVPVGPALVRGLRCSRPRLRESV
ncbi:hypothetical protein NDU88_001316 [Pleurodeles waltl]|uniref:Uncharacterized protein n=1 Tax=Pleurodeles waltl TaxID=8319 RepID=A0AAV7P3F5_PLEWA|nr:hypothetical protein NDU88_001316 [Pleurodeles waltl]